MERASTSPCNAIRFRDHLSPGEVAVLLRGRRHAGEPQLPGTELEMGAPGLPMSNILTADDGDAAVDTGAISSVHFLC